MAEFLLQFDASITSADVNLPPTFDVLVGGIVVNSFTLDPTQTSFGFFINSPTNIPASLTLRFNGGSGTAGDTISFSAITLNQTPLNLATDASTAILARGGTSALSPPADTFLRDAPTLDPVTISGTGGADTNLEGTTGADSIEGLGGNDRIRAFEDDDSINGGDGNDTIYGEGGADSVLGGAGDDLIFGNAGDDILFGEGDNDAIIGGAGEDVLSGGAGNDSLIGGADDDILYGEAGIDFLVGEGGDDILFGDGDGDFLFGGDGNDSLSGGDGADQVVGGAGSDLIFGGAGDDELIAEGEDDTVYGGAGDDDIFGGDGNDTISGGDNDDYILGGEGTDTIDGDDGADVIIGGRGADTIDGGAGNDILHGNGLDAVNLSTLISENPTLSFFAQSNSFYELDTNNANISTARSDASSSTLGNATVGTVNGHLASITTLAENTFIDSLVVADTWISHNDEAREDFWQYLGGAEDGVNFYNGNTAGTVVEPFFESFANNEPNDFGSGEDLAEFRTSATVNDISGGTNDVLIEYDLGFLHDDNAADTLSGGAGNDHLYGYGGNDILNGGIGNDFLIGHTGNDTLNGDDGSDQLYGGDGVDTINGGEGNDTIFGGAGADVLDGGNGDDTFYFFAGDIAAGESLDGGDGTGDNVVFLAAVSLDLTTTTFTNVENITASDGDDTITLTATDLTTYTSIDYGAGNDVQNLSATGDVSGLSFASISGLDVGNLTGTAGNDSLTITGGQLNTVLAGSGTVDLGAGATDTINLLSTSSDLNSYGNVDASIQGVEFFDLSSAAAGVTLSLAGQSEGFDITGSGNDDVVTTGDGTDTINGSVGADTLAGGGGDDTINGGAGNDILSGDFATSAGAKTQGWNYEYYDFGFGPSNLAGAGFTLNGGRDNSFTLTDSGTTSDFNPSLIDSGNQFALKFTATLTINTGGSYTFRTTSDDGSKLYLDGVEIVDNDGNHGTRSRDSTAQTLTAGDYLIEITYYENGGGQVLDALFSGPDSGGGFITLSNYVDATLPQPVSIVGPGNDVLRGEDGDDDLFGGEGDDELYGGDGLDSLTGEAGADTFFFESVIAFNDLDTIEDFSLPDNDAIDISDLLTAYTSGVDPITNFVQITDDGTDSLLRVDTTGSGTFGAAQDVASILGVTGLTDEALLETNGHLITS